MPEPFARPQAPWSLRLLPPFPAVAHRVLALVGREDMPINELGDLVKMDPSFAAELLRVGNSALLAAASRSKVSRRLFFCWVWNASKSWRP